MEGGAFRQKSLARESEKYVFIFLHQTREDSRDSYRLITEEYLDETFLHPVWFFLRPNGVEADEKNRNYHVALTSRQMTKILAGIGKEWGRGLSMKDWEIKKGELASAEALFAAADWAGAKTALGKLSKMKERSGLRDRARALLRQIGTMRELVAKSADLPDGLKTSVTRTLGKADLLATFRALKGREEPPAVAFYDLVVAKIREAIRLKPVRIDRVFLTGNTFYYLRAEWETDLPLFDGLVLQLSYLADGIRGRKTYEGYAIYDEVEPNSHHRAAFSMSMRDLKLRNVVNARAQLWLDGVMLSESLLNYEPNDFGAPDESNVRIGPDLLKEEQSLGANRHAKLRKYEIGRYPAAK